MKVQVLEEPGRFAFRFEAETIAEASMLMRFGMQRTTGLQQSGTFVFPSQDTIYAWISIRRKRGNSRKGIL
jgi:hypothetical protein